MNSKIICPEEALLPEIETISSSTNQDKIKKFLNDESNIIKGIASKVFYPVSSLEVATVVKEASINNINVTISGAGTGLTGSRVPRDGWIIATDKLISVVEREGEEINNWKDPETNIEYKFGLIKNSNDKFIRVPVSMSLSSIQTLVRSLGLFYPPDTTEISSFIGGNVATNASGARSFKYGSTRKYVKGLKIVLSNGEIFSLNPDQLADNNKSWIIKINNKDIEINVNSMFEQLNVSKNAVGFPLYKKMPFFEIFIGTEGIFGIITEVVLKLIPKPQNIFSIITYFSTVKDAMELVSFAKGQKIKLQEPIPLSVEYFDKNSLKLVKRKYPKIPLESIAAVYLEQDVESIEKIDLFLEFWLNQLEKINYIDSWAETDSKGIQKHKEFRHTLPITVHSIVRRNNVSKVGTDFAVPSEKFQEMLDLHYFYGDQFSDFQESRAPILGTDVSFVVYGHIGNDHLHMNFLPRNKIELEKAKELYLNMIKKIVEMKGTVTAEHGVGKKQYGGKPYLYYQIGDIGIKKLKALKEILDPDNILNRGNLFD